MSTHSLSKELSMKWFKVVNKTISNWAKLGYHSQMNMVSPTCLVLKVSSQPTAECSRRHISRHIYHHYVYLQIGIRALFRYTWLLTMALSKLVKYDVGSSTSQSYPDTPNHPPLLFNFPQREFGKKQIVKHSCQLSWFPKWKWLHYDENNVVVFCHLCVTALVKRVVK